MSTPRKEETLAGLQQKIAQALVVIQDRLLEPLSIEEVALAVGLSPTHFAAVFRGQVGESVHQHIRRLRLERGAAWLLVSTASLEEITRRTGFQTREAFARAFKQEFGLTPVQFRRQRRRSGCQLPAPTQVHWREGGKPFAFQPLPDLSLNLQVRIEFRPVWRLASMRYQGPLESCHTAWFKFLPLAWGLRLIGPQPRFIGIGYDDEYITDPSKLRYDTSILLPDNSSFRGWGPIVVREIPASQDVVHDYQGDFDGYLSRWDTLLYQWLPRQQWVPLAGGYALDTYHIEPDVWRHPIRTIRRFLKEIRVEMRIPVRDGAADKLCPES